MNITELTVHELKEKLEKKELTSYEIIKAYIEKIEEKEKDVQAFVTTLEKDALEKAEEIDKKIASGEIVEKLAGIPIGIKDNICTKGVNTTCSSKMLENFVAPYDATVMEKINSENLINLGKLNMDEFAMGGSTEHSYFHVTRNPWNLNKVPGGSSGGSAAAVAAGMVPWALGTDTGGSIREPASFCGVVGLKPTYGLVSRYGVVAFASSLDQVGPITKDVTDSAMLLNIITGKDKMDSTSVERPKVDYTKALKNDVKGLKIAVPKELFAEGINEEVKESLEKAIETYKKLGAEISEVSLNIAEYALASYYIIACAEASSNLGRFDGVRYGHRAKEFNNLKELYRNSRTEGFGPEVKRRIILGTYVLSSGYYDAYYKKAQQVRTLVMNKFKSVFDNYDVILTPTSPTVAFDIGSKINDPLAMYLADICTVSVNIAGLPGISIPCGVDKEGMPIGMQLIGNRFTEETLLNAAYTFEQKVQFREKYKPEFKK
ncbi:MAG: Asp-tRNA(Asn)/Glu-tRNA(Gln) amidotransferase subunit GatA [Clostridia bacterium]|jgi:aspartyl-tRNA(Asn)/glutamyl-tRNA(Gln) amidotransferase subunit A|nr:Asp-tRNA(Asn)/Glu-tRNA(Gln) amidotransferase subunit GatA [Clostridium sp.]MEE0128082.1 Asp-tRNA(Asn)/Glu-tRNA(Gln) amidotransferase subunit GatA [Clostridia bacterium]HJJ12322.1 Asp-tRNA(Asn)/Glu-tRNA(Gln) amidotransferase subunit GatA [Clostridiaceae bacterium]